MFFLAARYYKCPFDYFLHIRCPACGVTRGCMAALRLDFVSAFRAHPLFFAAPAALLYAVHRKRLRVRLSSRAEKIALILIIAAYLIVFVVRLL